MGTRSVRLDEDTYERIKRQKQPDETFSEAIDRLTRTPSLGELGGVVDEDRVERVEAAIANADAADADQVKYPAHGGAGLRRLGSHCTDRRI